MSTARDLTGLSLVLEGIPGLVRGAVEGPGLVVIASSLRDAVRAVSSAPAGAAGDATWVATETAGRVAIFGPDVLVTASAEGATVHSLRAVAGDRAVQCDFGDPTARADTSIEGLISGGLAGLRDTVQGATLAWLGLTGGGVRVRLAEGGQTTADWIFDEAGQGEPVAAVAERAMAEAAEGLEADFRSVAEPDDLPPRVDAGSVAAGATRAAPGMGATVAGVSATAAAAAAAALARRARAARSTVGEGSSTEEPQPPEAKACPNCAQAVPPGARFCTSCGADLQGATAAPPSEPSPEPRTSSAPPTSPAPPAPPTSPAPPAPPASPAPPAPPPTWRATHVVGPGGVNARPEADPQAAVSAQLAAGVQLAVVRTWGEWAQVVAENGWTGWVDGRRLRSLS